MNTAFPVDPIPVPHRQKPQRKFGRRMMVLAASLLCANAIIGERGMIESIRAEKAMVALDHEIESLREENDSLRAMSVRLREDLSLIEEVARQDLGLISRDEVVVVLSEIRRR